MNTNDQLESDVFSFFEQIESQSRGDRRETLRNLLTKYAHLNTSDCVLSHFDLKSIISNAKTHMSYQSIPIRIGDRNYNQVDSMDLPNLAVIEATISYLNGLNCFKRLPKFDYKK